MIEFVKLTKIFRDGQNKFKEVVYLVKDQILFISPSGDHDDETYIKLRNNDYMFVVEKPELIIQLVTGKNGNSK